MKRHLLSWGVTLFILLSPILLSTSHAQCPSATTTSSFGSRGAGLDMTYLSAQIEKQYYVRLTFKVVNYYKNNGMDYLACEMPTGAGVVSSGVSIKSPLERIYTVVNGTSVVNKDYPTFYAAKLVSVDVKSQFKSGGNFNQNYDTYTLDMSLYEFTLLNTLRVAVRAGGDGGGAGNERFFITSLDVTSCKTDLMGNVADFHPKMISGPTEPMTGDTVAYSIENEAGYTYAWGVPDVNDGAGASPGWKIISGQNTNVVRVKVGTAGGSMRVEVTNPALGSNNTNARTMPVTVIPNPLPVELVGFSGQPRNGVVDLSWSTATEIDNDRFEIERSANGKDFVKIGQVKGAGNSSVLLHYTYQDTGAPAGTVYYRLNQVDANSTQEYSKVIAIKNSKAEFYQAMLVHPNPVRDGLLTVSLNQGRGQNVPVTLKLVDLSGKTLYVQELAADAQKVQLMLHSLGLRKGLYIISLTSQVGSQVQRILVQ